MSAPTVFPLQPLKSAEPFSSLLHTRFQGRAKRGRGKAVSWPPEDQICQIRFFLSTEAPSCLGLDHANFHSNQSRGLPTHCGYLDGSLDIPPGFYGSIAKRVKVSSVLEVSMSVGIPFFTPQQFVQESDWRVADGDESQEAGLQRQRELRILEAFYPRPTSVPDSPGEPVEGGKFLDDDLVPTIPLVPIEDEDDSAEGSEHDAKVEFQSDVAVAEQGKLSDKQDPQLTVSGYMPGSQVSSEHVQVPTVNGVDLRAAAAAACMAVPKFGANGVVEQELLVEILRNPTLLKNLSSLNASHKDPAASVHGNEVGIVGRAERNPQVVNQFAGPINKGCQEASLNTGLPSPVSVLSDWTSENSTINLSRTPSILSDTSNTKNVSSCMPINLPFRHSHSRENVVRRMESVSAPLRGVNAFVQESGLGSSTSHVFNNGSALIASSVHMAAPLAPFPSQNAVHFSSGRMQPAQINNAVAPQIAVSSFSDSRSRSMQKENAGVGSMCKTGQKMARFCVYFNTPRGCRNGGNCAFLHQEMKSIAQ